MAQVLVRNLDDDLVKGLKVRARLRGISLETFLREVLKAAAPLTGDEKVALLEEFRRKHDLLELTTPPEDIIREDREERMATIMRSIDDRH